MTKHSFTMENQTPAATPKPAPAQTERPPAAQPRKSASGDLRRTLVVFLLATLSVIAATAKDRPLSLHPNNPHYFLWRGQPTVLITSAEHYGAVVNLDFDYAAVSERA
ncbi:MAG: hypothetical protein V9H26_09500 [Verrucomicrobiota bacterium]